MESGSVKGLWDFSRKGSRAGVFGGLPEARTKNALGIAMKDTMRGIEKENG
jgi:hypothetical protein